MTLPIESLLRQTDKAGVYHLPLSGKEEIVVAAETNGYQIFRIDLTTARDKSAMLALIGEAMAFPEWFGHNADALFDCLTDLGWRPAEGYLVLLEHCDALTHRVPDDFAQLLQVFEAAAEEWRNQGVPLWCLVEMQADGIAWLPGLA